MIFNLNSEADRRDFKRYCNEVYLWGVEKGGVVEVAKKHRKRSTSQNAYLHCLIDYYASEIGLSREEVKHDIFKKHCNSDIFCRERVNRRGQKIMYIRSSADLDKAEMTLAIERFRNHSSMEASLYLPAPDEYDALLEAEKQISKYKEFL